MAANLELLSASCPAYTSDSRCARPGDIFVALRGSVRDGHEFVPALLAAGVRCVAEQGTGARLNLDGTATAGQGDFQVAGGTLTIPAGQTSGEITVKGVGDSLSKYAKVLLQNRF